MGLTDMGSTLPWMVRNRNLRVSHHEMSCHGNDAIITVVGIYRGLIIPTHHFRVSERWCRISSIHSRGKCGRRAAKNRRQQPPICGGSVRYKMAMQGG